jgi:hypothetical protein
LANGAKTVVLDSDGALFVSGAIVPDEDAVHDLGHDSSRFQNIYLSASSTINLGSTSISVNSNKLQVNGNNFTVDSLENNDKTVGLDSNGVLTVPGSIVPDTDIAYDLGSDSNRFRDLYLSGSTINLGGTSISINSSGQLQVGGSNVAIDSLVNGTNTLTLNADGTLSFPNNTLSQGPLTDFSIKTSTEIKTTATVTNSGSGYGAGGQSEVSGGSGDGLIVSYTAGEAGSVGTVQVEDPGTGYQTGDVLTLTSGDGNATITLTLAPVIYNWTFGADATTTFPGKFNFYSRSVTKYVNNAQALVFNKSVSNKAIATSGGTADSPGVETLYIVGGDAYEDPVTYTRTSAGGSITLQGGNGSPAGTILINGGRGAQPGAVNISGGTADDGLGVRTGIAGAPVRIFGGQGTPGAVGGAVLITGGAGSGGDGGEVIIVGGAGTNSGPNTNGGNVRIEAGTAQTAGGVGGKIILKTNSGPQRGTENQWDFTVDGRTTFPVATAPNHSYGAAGDKAGMLAFDSTYIYYCTDDYVNDATDIWKRVELISAVW